MLALRKEMGNTMGLTTEWFGGVFWDGGSEAIKQKRSAGELWGEAKEKANPQIWALEAKIKGAMAWLLKELHV